MNDLNGLVIFAKVATLKSFAKAARAMNVPTTTVSRKVQALEQQLGAKLLNRSTRTLSLTEVGEQILPKAQLITDTLTEVELDAEQAGTKPIGTLVVSAPPALSRDLLGGLLAQFHRRYPSIDVNLISSNRFQDLTKQNIDFALRLGPLMDSNLIALPLSKVHYCLVASADYLAQHPTPQHPNELEQYSLIRNHADGFYLPWKFQDEQSTFEVNHTGKLICDDLQVAKEMAINGAGIAYLPYSIVGGSIDNGELIPLLAEYIHQDKRMLLVYKERQYLPLKSQLFLQFIRERKGEFEALLAP
ncbi:LysR family transcriptional regulator [Paraferrimonas haliotis]|uniref:LysR family transcriptional regulator n=1 Tax=Paraferrimonas haliotis TaxID=2013866 RepID=UPI000BA91B63|nr:LysR family transcriptional regulator [Paraferrimonas haliotis]